MSTVGVIAEYNPYHNGHKYLIDQAMQRTNADKVIALMSGSFLQRGNPAMADKYSRAEAAVIAGVDAVFELPVIYATGSSRDFATGAVALLSALNSVDYIAFGVEDEDINTINKVSEILVAEPDDYKKYLNNYLARGLSYPSASEKAIVKILGKDVEEMMSKPNNILGISYLSAMKKLNSKLIPILIKRNDQGYFSTDLNGSHSSATAIRNAISMKTDISKYVPKKTTKAYSIYFDKDLPESSWLTPYINSRIIYDRNLDPKISQLDKVMDMNPELLNRLRKAPLPSKYVELADFLKTKNLTMTRVSRVLLHMVLGIIDSDRNFPKDNGYSDYSEYINLLAFKKTNSQFIKEITEKSDLKVINKKSEFVPETAYGERMWQLDKLATDLYNQLVYENINIRLHSELTSTVRVV